MYAHSLCFGEGRTLPNLRIIINGEDWKKSPLSGFFEKHFYRQKGACVTSGGIFIDLSGVLRFSLRVLVYSQKKKSYAEDLILSYTRAHNKR
jgi:spermidine synthase